MTVKKTLSAIIADLGSTEFARRVRRHPSYMSRVKLGHTPGSVELLGRALGAFGASLDLEGTIRELVPDEVEIGRCGAGVDHAQP